MKGELLILTKLREAVIVSINLLSSYHLAPTNKKNPQLSSWEILYLIDHYQNFSSLNIKLQGKQFHMRSQQ